MRTSTTDGLTWSDGFNNGGVVILDYRIKRRESGTADPYVTVDTGIIGQSQTLTGLTLGVTYDFTVEARNSVGYSDTSDSITILHAIPPEKPIAPTTTNAG